MSFKFTPSSVLTEVIIIEGKRFEDERGFFSETFRNDEFEEYGIPPFVQENHSRSSPLCFRGMHYQLNPCAQGKLVRCVSGSIYDFVVDIRKDSPTYGKTIKINLTEHTNKMVYVPPGFAHGFFSYGLKDVHVLYKVTSYYSPEHDRCICWSDPTFKITLGGHVNVSDKDANAPLLNDVENNFYYQER